jgi:hypothetical protein
MSYFRYERILKHLSYKPNMKLELEPPHIFPNPALVLRAEVENSYNPGEKIKVGFRTEIPEFFNERDDHKFIEWVFQTIMKWERHEAQEWFKLDGVPLDDPHKNDR